MTLFPLRRPQLGLSVSARTISLVEWRHGWVAGRPGGTLRRVLERELPSGLVRPSHTDLNIADLPALAEELRTLVASSGPTTVALSLSDLCAQLDIFEFDTLPEKAVEREALLKWRFQRESPLPLGDMQIAFRPFRIEPRNLPSPEGKTSGYRVLAMAIRRDILTQYEQVCDLAGLFPVAIGLSSLQLFDLFRLVMTRADEVFFASSTTDSFSFLAIREGCPLFLRSKPVRRMQVSLDDEVLGTLQAYHDQYPVSVDPQGDLPPRPLFLVGDNHSRQAEPEPSSPPLSDGYVFYPTPSQPWGVTAIPLGLERLRVSYKGLADCSVGALSALAGVVAG